MQGYDVVLAASGRKGVDLFRRERPDVVVLDLNMPEVGGIAVLQQIRSLKPNQPVIVLTGGGTPEKEQHVYTLGVHEFVEKEFPPRLFLRCRRRRALTLSAWGISRYATTNFSNSRFSASAN